jgi:hypothetical protein
MKFGITVRQSIYQRICHQTHSLKNGGKNLTIKETITKLFEERQDLLNHNYKVFITGHSLGAGLATLAALHISKIAEN